MLERCCWTRSPISHAKEARALPPFVTFLGRYTGEHSRTGQAPEARGRQVLLSGCELPTHMWATCSALCNGPGIPEQTRKGSQNNCLGLLSEFISTYNYPDCVGYFCCILPARSIRDINMSTGVSRSFGPKHFWVTLETSCAVWMACRSG